MTKKKAVRRSPATLEEALNAFESGLIDEIVRRRRKDDFEALRRLVSLEPDIKKQHRRRAIYALGRWGDPVAVADIREVLPELDRSEKATAIDSLGRLGTEDAVKAVAAQAEDPSVQVRKFVAKALQRMGGREASSRLRSMAKKDPEDWIRDLAGRRERKR